MTAREQAPPDETRRELEDLRSRVAELEARLQKQTPSSIPPYSLSQHYELLRLSQLHGEAAVWSLDLRSHEFEVTPEYYALYGLDPATRVSPGQWIESLHPDDREPAAKALERARQTGDFQFDFRIRHPSKGKRWLAGRGRAVAEEGTFARLVGITTDITERRSMEQALENQARLTRAITDNASTSLFIMDDRQHCVFMNPAAEKLTGYTLAEAQGRPLHDVVHHTRPDGSPYPLSECPIDRAFPENDRMQGEEIFVHKDGSFYNVAYTASPLRDAKGINGTVIEVIDITEQKRILENLRRRTEELETILNLVPMPVWIALDERCSQVQSNRAAQLLQETAGGPGASPSSGMNLTLLRDGRELDPSEMPLQLAAASGEPQLDFDLEALTWDGRKVALVGSALPLRDPSGAVRGSVCALMDYSARKNIENELRRLNRELEQFVYTATHDLQEPIRTVSIFSELLIRRHSHRLDGQAAEFLERVRGGALRMEALIRDLLEYTRIGALRISAQPAPASAALEAALENLAGAIRSANVSIRADQLPEVRMDPVHLQQLFQNLIGNAIKYREPSRPPVIHVSAEPRDATWQFSVADNGIGIDPIHKERIFGLFKRLHNASEYSGTGIGLAICQRIVERYGGRIWVESRPGEGATFRFTIPV
ncbi:MAG: PAS domain S-box protein [Bryobacteraceae bacterium]|nr:PAS domain S-box protein [Bryobacteraceae bacterium]